jgi:hypothetical protein
MQTLLMLGDAPRLEADLAALVGLACPVMAINRAGLRYMGRIDYWCSYHPEKFWQEWRALRASLGGNDDYQELRESDVRNIPLTGSSTLLGVLWGLERFDQIIIAGAPLDDENYHQYRQGWKNESKHLAGRVRSLSGWTKTFLEGLNHGA